jgi:ABC-2 type transport system permease protein
MIRLFLIEYYKLVKSRSSVLLITAYFFFLTLIAAIAAIKFDIGPIQFHLAEQGIFNFPFIWHFNTFIAAFFKLFLAVVIVSMVSNEYSNRTLKQNLIDGLSKKEFIASKLIMVVVFSALSALFVALISAILGGIYSDYTEWSLIVLDLQFLGLYFLKLIGFFSLCLFLGILIKRSAFALGVLIVLGIAEQIAFGIGGELLYEFMTFEEKSDAFALAQEIKSFFPLQASFNLIHEPFTRLSAVQSVVKELGETMELDYYTSAKEIGLASLYAFLYIWGSYKLIQRRDL